MKIFTLVFYLLLNTYYISSQEYVPMAVDSATWFLVSNDENPNFSVPVVLRLEGDTIIISMTYSKIYHYTFEDNAVLLGSRKILGFLRDDIAGRKVYGGFLEGMQDEFGEFLREDGRCDWGESDIFNEYQLYDFNVSEEDTINSCMLVEKTIVSKIDTIERYGFRRRNLFLNDFEQSIMTEGIGTCIGIFKGNQCFNTGGGFSYNLYDFCIGSFSNCNLLLSNEEIYKQDKLEISPNPVSNKLLITNSSRLKKILIFDIRGNLIESFTEINEIEMGSYPRGIYIYIINAIDLNGKIHSERIIKI